jgi:hypothetical protein
MLFIFHIGHNIVHLPGSSREDNVIFSAKQTGGFVMEGLAEHIAKVTPFLFKSMGQGVGFGFKNNPLKLLSANVWMKAEALFRLLITFFIANRF